MGLQRIRNKWATFTSLYYIFKHLLISIKTLQMDITRWSTLKSDWLYSLQPRWRSSIQSAKTRLGADCGSDHELFTAKFRLKLKKVGKTTRPFRYDLNQICYDYTMEVRNRFKGLVLIECLMNYGWSFMRLYRRQRSRPSPRKRNAKTKQNKMGIIRSKYFPSQVWNLVSQVPETVVW